MATSEPARELAHAVREVGVAEILGARLRAARLSAGLTQAELATRAGISVRNIRDLESGRSRRPRASTVRLLIEALGEHGIEYAAAYRADVTPAHAGRRGLAMLPRDVAGFVGRSAALDALDELLGPAAGSGVVLITGPAGVGKTSLALRWAHRAHDRFPDGRLYLNLRGYDPSRPVTPDEALFWLLRDLGLAAGQVPDDTESRAAQVRSLIGDRALLLVLDNARDAEHVRPLLPGSGPSRVLLTSRNEMPGLVAREGADRIRLDVLPEGEAVDLFTHLVGPRAQADREASSRLVDRCHRLPLAIRVLAELAVSRSRASLAHLAQEAARQPDIIDLLDAAGDPRAGVAEVFSWSYRSLDPEDAALFRALGLHPVPQFDLDEVAALAGRPVDEVRSALHRLSSASLVDAGDGEQFLIHDVLRDYARHLATAAPLEEQQAAMVRLVHHYCSTVQLARAADPGSDPMDAPEPPAWPRRFGGLREASAWLESRADAVARTAAAAIELGMLQSVRELARATVRPLELAGRYDEAMTIAGLACEALEALQLPEDHVIELTALGTLQVWRGRLDEAMDCYERARQLAEPLGDPVLLARVHGNLGLGLKGRGRLRAAVQAQRTALALLATAGPEPPAYAREATLLNLAWALIPLGEVDEAARRAREALEVADRAGDRRAAACAWTVLGDAAVWEREPDLAIGYYHRALHEIGEVDRQLEADIALGLGEAHRLLGQWERAEDELTHAIDMFQTLGHRSESAALIGYGHLLVDRADPSAAVAAFTAGLERATRAHDGYQTARAHGGLAEAIDRAGGPSDEAESHRLVATALLAEMGIADPDARCDAGS